MDHTLSVMVFVNGRDLRLLASGCLTEVTQRDLRSLLRRVRTRDPRLRITVDLTDVHHVETAGLELLCRAVEHENLSAQPVEFRLPETLPTSAADGEPVPWRREAK